LEPRLPHGDSVGTFDLGAPNANGNDYDSDTNANGVEDGAEYDRTHPAPR